MSLACLHFTTPHSVPTPTVCGHAEACPSTTYANYFLYLHPIAVAPEYTRSHIYNFCAKNKHQNYPIYLKLSLYRFCFTFSTVIRPINFLQPRSLSLVQRHIVLRRSRSVGMPRHALRRRMPNTAGLRPRSPARWAGVIPQQKLRPAGWVLPDVK